MAEIGRFIKRKNLKTRILSVILVIAILAGSFVWFGNNDMKEVVAEDKEKDYLEYIADRMESATTGDQQYFNVLEIVPYDGLGEFRYFLNDQSVLNYFNSEAGQTKIKDNAWCLTSEREWKYFKGNGFGNLGYKIRYNSITKKYEVQGNDSFLVKAFGDQAGIFSEKIKLQTVEANDLTADMVNKADLIVFSSADHDSGTLKMYEAWTGTTDHGFYDSTGAVASDDTLYYATYEKKAGGSLVSRDMSWAACEALLNCTIEGRSFEVTPGKNIYLKTPVILDNREISGLDNALNVYKFNFVYRSLCGYENLNYNDELNNNDTPLKKAYIALKAKLEESSDSNSQFGTAELNSFLASYDGGSYASKIENNCLDANHNTWLTDYFFSYTGSQILMPAPKLAEIVEEEEEPEKRIYFNKQYCSWGTVKIYFFEGGNAVGTAWPGTDMIKVEGTTNDYYAVVPAGATHCIFNNGSGSQTGDLAIPADGYGDYYNYVDDSKGSWNIYDTGDDDIDDGGTDTIITDIDYSSGKGVTSRTGSSGTIANVLQFLLGSKSGQATRYSYGTDALKVLEIQPCNAFSYDGWKDSDKDGYRDENEGNIDEIKALGNKLLMSGVDSWTLSNYTSYIQVTGVTTNALNGMNNDLVSDFDIIIIGENIDILNKDANNRTIYNDRTLNGYVYLAFGDLFKIATNALGILPSEYAELQNTGQRGWYTPLNESHRYMFTEYVYNTLNANGGNGKYYLHKLMQDYYQKGGKYDDDSNGYGTKGEFYSKYQLGNVRGVDNDITDITREKLLDFAKSGKAIILSDSLYNLDDYTVYPTSDMYYLCKELLSTDATGNRKYGIYSMDNMAGAVNHRITLNPIIEMISYPVEPTYDSNGIVNKFNSTNIDFKFNLKGQPGKTYRIKLYADKNSDGVYRGIEEDISDDRNELYFSRDIVMSSTGEMEYLIDSQLSDNFIGMLAWKIEVVQLIKEDGEWVETAYSNSVKGYSAIKKDVQKTITVLQIMPNEYDYPNNGGHVNPVTLDMETNAEFKTLLGKISGAVGYDVNIQSINVWEYEKWFNPNEGGIAYNGESSSGGWIYFKNTNGWSQPYAHYYHGSDGYTTVWPGKQMTKITEDTYAIWVPDRAQKVIFNDGKGNQLDEKTLNGWNKRYEGGSWKEYKFYDDNQSSKPYDHLATYDMVVIGFADMFGAAGDKTDATGWAHSSDISNKYGALDNIVDYIDAGKSVLFTHDTIAWRTSPNYDAQKLVNPSEGRLEMHWTKLLQPNGDANSASNSYHDNLAHNITVSLRDKVGLDKYGITLDQTIVDPENPNKYDKYETPIYANGMEPAYEDNTDPKKDANGNYLVEELHGFTPWFYYRNNFLHAFYSDYTSDYNKMGIFSLKPFDKNNTTLSSGYFDYNKSGTWTTTKVSQVNKGSINMYPYKISEELTVELTHAQYYSINMEDEDVVVWYTLAGDGKDGTSKYYGYTDKDVENNYYIYSKNNVTYSGAGHQTMTQDMEKMLFVNTLIKAIAGGNSSPVLTVTNGAEIGGIHMVYVNSSNTAKDYEIHILGRDADLVSPEAAGINYVIRESDLPGLKANKVNVDIIGKFEWAKIYWNVPGVSEPKLIKEYDGNGTDPLRNGVIKEFRLGDSSVLTGDSTTYYYDKDGDGDLDSVNALQYIELLTEGVGEVAPEGADFTIVVSDWLGATTTIKVRLVERELFMLD